MELELMFITYCNFITEQLHASEVDIKFYQHEETYNPLPIPYLGDSS